MSTQRTQRGRRGPPSLIVDPVTEVGVRSIVPPALHDVIMVVSAGLALDRFDDLAVLAQGFEGVVLRDGRHDMSVTVVRSCLRLRDGDAHLAVIRRVLQFSQRENALPTKMCAPL